MRIIKAFFIVTIFCVVSIAQPSIAQQTANQTQPKDQSLSSQTPASPLPEKKLTLSDITQIQIRLSEALHQQNQSLSADTEKLRSQGIEVVPETRLVIKNGTLYLVLMGQTLVPMIGGGASGCLGSSVPENVEKVGQAIFLAPKSGVNLTPEKDSAKKN